MASVCNVEDANESTKLLASTTLRLVALPSTWVNRQSYGDMISCRVGGSWSLIKDYLKHFNHLTIKNLKGTYWEQKPCKRFWRTERALLRWSFFLVGLWYLTSSGFSCKFCTHFCSDFDLQPLQNILMQLDEATDPWGIKVSKVEVFNILFLIFPCSFILSFAGERCSTASRVAKSDGSRSRGSSGSASQGLKIIIPQISLIWHLIVILYIYQTVLLVKSYKKSGDRCWGRAEGEQSVEGGLRHHHRVGSSSST